MDTHAVVNKWGAQNLCPACQKAVYPGEQVFGADRRPFHRRCITCGTRGCGYEDRDVNKENMNNTYFRNSLTTKGIHKHGNMNVCDMCHEDMYGPAKVNIYIFIFKCGQTLNLISGIWTCTWHGEPGGKKSKRGKN